MRRIGAVITIVMLALGAGLVTTADPAAATVSVRTATTSVLSVSPSPTSEVGTPVTLTAVVGRTKSLTRPLKLELKRSPLRLDVVLSGFLAGSGPVPGTVSFLDGSTVLATASLTNSTASFTTSSLAVGRHDLRVRFEPSSDFAGSTSKTVLHRVVGAPTAVADTATVSEDAGATPIAVLANDTTPAGGTMSIASVTQPANGTATITGGGTGLTYAPDADYCNNPPGTTPDTFTYTLNGGSTATVSVTVTCVDDPPTAVEDSASVATNSAATAISVLSNDTDPDGGAMSIASVTQPANGTVVITGGGTGLTYQPNAGYCDNTPDTFGYTLNGGSTTTVSVTVSCVDVAPTAVEDAATVDEDAAATAIAVLANDTDSDAGPKVITSVTQSANGTATITGGGTGLTYQPNVNYCNDPPGTSPDTFTYTLNGGSTTTVSVKVTCIDDPAIAVNDSITTGVNQPVAISVLTNDVDVDGSSFAIVSFTQPANGTVTLTNSGTTLTYTPNINYCNTPPGPPETFSYTITGGSTATVSVTINCL